jgi:hypothetical protein
LLALVAWWLSCPVSVMAALGPTMFFSLGGGLVYRAFR